MTCVYYENNKRLSLATDHLLSSGYTVISPAEGTLVFAKNGVKCVGNKHSFMGYALNSTPVMLTDDKTFAEYNGKELPRELCRQSSLYIQLLDLLKMKHDVTGNPFSLELGLEGCTVEASVKSAGKPVSFTVKTPGGEGYSEGEEILGKIQQGCKGVRSFSCSVETDDCTRMVSVKKSQVEIFKEIAHYLGRGLVFTYLDEKLLGTRIVYMSHLGCVEQRFDQKTGKTFTSKLPFAKFRVAGATSLAATEAGYDAVCRSDSIIKAALGGVMYA